MASPGQYNMGRFAYTGQIWLPELGMYHYKARICSPTLGRFLCQQNSVLHPLNRAGIQPVQTGLGFFKPSNTVRSLDSR